MNKKTREKYGSSYVTDMMDNKSLKKKWRVTEYNAILATYGVQHKDHDQLYRSFQSHYNLLYMKVMAGKYMYYAMESKSIRIARFLLTFIERTLNVNLPSVDTVTSVVDHDDINPTALKELLMKYHEPLENMLAYYGL